MFGERTRYGQKRVEGCYCEYNFTCGLCLRGSALVLLEAERERERDLVELLEAEGERFADLLETTEHNYGEER